MDSPAKMESRPAFARSEVQAKKRELASLMRQARSAQLPKEIRKMHPTLARRWRRKRARPIGAKTAAEDLPGLDLNGPCVSPFPQVPPKDTHVAQPEGFRTP